MSIHTGHTPATVHFLNAGQGDSIVIESPQHLVIIDSNIPQGHSEPPLLNFLKQRLDDGLPLDVDLIVITHPDRDHYRGMLQAIDFVEAHGGAIRRHGTCLLLAEFKELVDEELKTYEPSHDPMLDSTTARQLRAGADEFQKLTLRFEHSTFKQLSGSKRLETFGAIRLSVLGPRDGTIRRNLTAAFESLRLSWLERHVPEKCASNQMSAIVRADIHKSSFILTGDTEHEEWGHSVAEYSGVYPEHYAPADVVKAPHHGARSGSSAFVWNKSLKKDGFVVMSAGHHEHYKHPHLETLTHIKDHLGQGDRIYCTNVCPHHKTQFEDSMPNHLRVHLGLETGGSRRPRCVPYHGSVRFEVTPAGVSVTPEHATPHSICLHHKTKS